MASDQPDWSAAASAAPLASWPGLAQVGMVQGSPGCPQSVVAIEVPMAPGRGMRDGGQASRRGAMRG